MCYFKINIVYRIYILSGLAFSKIGKFFFFLTMSSTLILLSLDMNLLYLFLLPACVPSISLTFKLNGSLFINFGYFEGALPSILP